MTVTPLFVAVVLAFAGDTVVSPASVTAAVANASPGRVNAAGEVVAVVPEEKTNHPAREIRVGLVGLDTSHAIAFAETLNAKNPAADVAGCRVTLAYARGSPDIPSSVSRVPEYTRKITAMGIPLTESLDEMASRVDAVLLETNDGRPHAEQALPFLMARKPVFIDKPIAGSLVDAVRIADAAKRFNTPVFSSSSLRYTPGAQTLRSGAKGKVLGADCFSPCSLEKTHPDLFWYGIHGVETLYTVMGPGCAQVIRVSAPGQDVAVGRWSDGRIGLFRGMRDGKPGYGGTAFTERGVEAVGNFAGYRPLVVEIVRFFRTGVSPVPIDETLELYAFMEAADESKRRGGAPVNLAEVLARAKAEAAKNPLGGPANDAPR
jgi:hypothetical protein